MAQRAALRRPNQHGEHDEQGTNGESHNEPPEWLQLVLPRPLNIYRGIYCE